MTPERWSQIEKVYHGALERPAGERAVYLAQACGGDGELRQEVESLLRQDDKTGDLLEAPALEIAAKAMANEGAMSLAGKQLGSYQVVAQIGAGGMGEVYRAKDTKLGREVAIKVLPPEFVKDAERLSRFRREAKLLASLNHPNIATIYGLEDSGEIHFLVMELVEGQTLAARLASGPIPVTDALKIGQQIAEALEHAHEHKVIHRDLKPANVILTKTGRIKVLDFGLAKAFTDEQVDPADAPTVSMLPTEVGRVMGTPAYMSPEQAQGKHVDKQTDIWAFGCVLYELLTGRRAFPGDNVSQTIATVLRAEPDWRKLPSDTPQTIRTLLRRCLQKEQNRRFHSAADLALELEDALTLPASTAAAEALPLPDRRRNVRKQLGWVASVIVALVAITFAGRRLGAPAVAPKLMTVTVSAPGTLIDWGCPVISPDGGSIALIATDASGKTKIWLRSLSSQDAKPVEGTENADGHEPFWSPDSRYLAFFSDRKLKKVDLTTGTVQVIADAPTGREGAWNKDGVIIFAPRSGSVLHTVSADGGPSTPLTTAETPDDTVGGHRYPRFHPDGRHFVFWASGKWIAVGSLDSKESKKLLPINSTAAFAPDGSLLYVSGETLVSQHFDVNKMELTGQPTPIASRVARYEPWSNADFSVSENGVLVYRLAGFSNAQLVWVDRNGDKLGTVGNAEYYHGTIRISPDGKRAAVVRTDNQTGQPETWLVELSRGVETRLRSESSGEDTPVWSPDGAQIAFSSGGGIYLKTLATGKEELLLQTNAALWPTDWSRDGKLLAYTSRSQESFDVGLLDFHEDRKARLFVHTAASEAGPSLSPDGRWVAYHSDESGRDELYVRSVSTEGESLRLSEAGSDSDQEARWRADGKELFFLDPSQEVMAVPITKGTSEEFGRPHKLFALENDSYSVSSGVFDVTPDGQRFLIRSRLPRTDSSLMTVVLNWTAALKQ